MSRNHGGRGTRIYSIWKDIRKRCNNPNAQNYKWYGVDIANKNLSKALGLPLTDKQRNARMENAKRLNNQINLNTKYHFE